MLEYDHKGNLGLARRETERVEGGYKGPDDGRGGVLE